MLPSIHRHCFFCRYDVESVIQSGGSVCPECGNTVEGAYRPVRGAGWRKWIAIWIAIATLIALGGLSSSIDWGFPTGNDFWEYLSGLAAFVATPIAVVAGVVLNWLPKFKASLPNLQAWRKYPLSVIVWIILSIWLAGSTGCSVLAYLKHGPGNGPWFLPWMG